MKISARKDRRQKYVERKSDEYSRTLARRALDLIREGVAPEHAKNQLAGYTLGRLRLIDFDGNHSTGISQQQYEAGMDWQRLAMRYDQLNGFRRTTKTAGFDFVSYGMACGVEPEADEIAAIRRRLADCYRELNDACKDHGGRVRQVTYGVVIENWHIARLDRDDYGLIRIGLNAIQRGLR